MSEIVKDLLPEVTLEIKTEREKMLKALLKTKSQEIEAARKMLAAMEEQYQKLLETKIDDFLFPHEFKSNKNLGQLDCRNIGDK